MIAVDTNILVYAHRGDSRFHAGAFDAIRRLAASGQRWAIPWSCLHEFLAIVTHPRIYDPPTPLEQAIIQIEAWLDSPSLTLLSEGIQHWDTLKAHVLEDRTYGPAFHDARVATICADAGVRELWTADRDFGRFAIRTHNPLTD